MWGAFVTGFAEGATELIKEENKSISNRVLAEMETTLKKRMRAEEEAQTKRDEYRQQAMALQTLSGGRLTETQIVGILSGGEADTVIKQLRSRQVGPEKLAKLFVPASPDDQAQLEEYLSEVGKLTGTVPTRVGEDTTAFGLPTRVGERKRKELLAKTGMTEEELYQTQMTTPVGVAGTLDLSALAEEKEEDTPTIKQLQGRLADEAVKNNMNVGDYIKNTDTGAALAARIEGRRLQGTDNEEEKARTAAQIRTLVNTRLQEEIAPLQFKSITYDPNLQDFVVTIPGSPEAKQFLEKRRNVAADVFKNAGLLKGNKLSDRNAADAISPFAEVDYDNLTITRWRPVAGSRGGAEASPVPAPRGEAAPMPTPAPMPAPTGVKPIPRDANGKVDRSKLVAGEQYASSTGEVRIWNGTSFQPVK
jgi:hypothetical protein